MIQQAAYCLYCLMGEPVHANGKCLFSPTAFSPILCEYCKHPDGDYYWSSDTPFLTVPIEESACSRCVGIEYEK
jgi:hypothetical protein